jgi:hypothetical protein
MGTPMDQIPRIGFEPPAALGSLAVPAIRTVNGQIALNTTAQASTTAITNVSTTTVPVTTLALDPRQARQVTSYVDLDAPAEGDLELNYG